MDGYFQNIKKDVEKNSSTLVEAVKLAQNTHNQINEHMLRVSTEVAANLEKKMAIEVDRLAKGIDTVDNNVKIVYNELKSWRENAERNDLIVDNRLHNIENYLLKNSNLIGDAFSIKKTLATEIKTIKQTTLESTTSSGTSHSMQGFLLSK